MGHRVPIVVAAAAALLLAGCGGSSGSGSNQSGGTSTSGGGDIKVGWTPLSNPVDESRIAFDKGIKDGIEAAGGKYLYCSPSPAGGATGDPAKQASCVDTFVSQGAKAIIVYPIDIAALAPSLKKATDKGIKVYDFTGPAPASTGIKMRLTVFSGDREAGMQAGQALVDALTQKNGSPKGNVLEVQGLLTTEAAIERGGGFHDVVDKDPGIKIVQKAADWDSGKAGPIVRDYLTAHPDTDAVYMHSGAAYLPPTEATLKQIGRWAPIGSPKHVILVAGDSSNQTLYAFKCGYMDQNVDLGFVNISRYFADAVMKDVTTGKLPAAGSTIQTGDPLFPTAKIVNQPQFQGLQMLLSALKVTKDNVGDKGLFGNAVQPEPNGATACK